MFFKQSAGENREKKSGMFSRMKQALGATKESLVGKIESVLSSHPTINENVLDDLEGTLLSADLGVRVSEKILDAIREKKKKGILASTDDAKNEIKQQLLEILTEERQTERSSEVTGTRVWMVVGVNGTGKTTTVGKLSARIALSGGKVLVCAADTFRAAAIEQLSVWTERSGADLIKSSIGKDPSAVLHDALVAAVARKSDIVIIDTAGRLHTKGNLMQELEKMRRVAGKNIPGAPHEVLLVIDATTGQNGLSQAKEFKKCTGITGLIITKLDGTAKGGIVFSISQELGVPVRYIGVGESLEDLLEFSPDLFVDSLFQS